MPISGFKAGQAVLTPSIRTATVIRIKRVGGREKVLVRYDAEPIAIRWFDASTLRMVETR